MSDSLGQVYLAHDRRSQFMDLGMDNRGDYSESTAQAIDKEIRQIIFAQYKVALDILKQRRDVLAKGASLLLDKEKIDHDEIKALMQGA
jgi:cell division protease FtsH